MAVPHKRNHRGGLVAREQVSKRGSRDDQIRPFRGPERAVPGSAQAPATGARVAV